MEAIRQLEESKSSGFVYRFEKPLFDEENINLYQVEKRLSMTGGETPQWNMATFRPCFTVVQTSGSQSRLEFELVNVDAGVLREQICKCCCDDLLHMPEVECARRVQEMWGIAKEGPCSRMFKNE